MKKTTTTTPSSSRCRTQKSVSYEWRPFEAPSKVPRPPPCGSTGSCATRTRRTDLHLRVCADGAFRRSLNSARTKDLTFQAPKRDFLVPDAPKTSTLCTPHKLGRDPWLLICTWGGAQTRDLAIPVELSSLYCQSRKESPRLCARRHRRCRRVCRRRRVSLSVFFGIAGANYRIIRHSTTIKGAVLIDQSDRF